ncbi:hypothetical protein GCM10010405_43480 [Streptomyces macrosporus]|uniref:Uncharacterized protein n=1 Tax=Streptomyces macrosporus TaxID=44032 RepID=A0ABN3KEX6_9ACTN
MRRGLAVLGLAAGQEVTEAQLRNLFGEGDRHPHTDRLQPRRAGCGLDGDLRPGNRWKGVAAPFFAKGAATVYGAARYTGRRSGGAGGGR